jgi:dTDP-4-amino-4,6-dideoxygalactose transaminase
MKSWDIVRGFECALAEYTGARYCVAVNSCTSAARLAFDWVKKQLLNGVGFPTYTYRSMPSMANKCGIPIYLDDRKWSGQYLIANTNIWDCALTLRPGMYEKGTVQLLSFHPQKPLALSSGGGAILHDDPEADRFYRLDRFDGRTEGVGIQGDDWPFAADHCYMFPGQAGEGIHRLEIFKAAHPGGLTMPQPDYEDLVEKMERRG